MELFVLGTSHAVAPVDVRERLHVELAEAHDALEQLVRGRGVLAEAVPLSTCARFELYAVTPDPGRAEAVLRRLVRRRTRTSDAALTAHLYEHRGDAAVKHLLRVASGLDSVIFGEDQILGQVRAAAHDPRGTRTRGPTLHRLFEVALSTGKRVRSETGIGRGATSLASAAVGMVESRMGSLRDVHALVLGAGETGGLVARLLHKGGVRRLVVANRTEAAATGIADPLGAEAAGLRDLDRLLTEVDLVVGAIGGEGPVLSVEQVRAAVCARAGHRPGPLHLVDMGHPRNFDPAVLELPDVALLDLEQVFERVESARTARAAHVPRAEAIVEEQSSRFLGWMRSRESLPVLRAIREHALAIALAEADRLGQSNGEEERMRLRRLARSIARTLLHAPTMALREADPSSSAGRRLIESAASLFGVDAQAESGPWQQ